MDPFQGLASLVTGLIKNSTTALWWKALFSMALSAVISYLVTNGGLLIAGKPSLIAHGYGQVVAGGAMIVCFIKERNKIFKGISLFVPNQEVVKTLATEFQEIQNQQKLGEPK